MNILLKKSNYITKQGKSSILFDCYSGKYRKRINTNVYVPSDSYQENINLIRKSHPKHVSLNIALKKLEEKKDLAIFSYNENKWTYNDLETFLKSGIELYSIDEYVNNQFGDSKNIITHKDYVNVVKVLKKHLKMRHRIKFDELLDPQSIRNFKLNALKNGIKQSSINSYLKKLKVIMSSAYNHGYINEKFNIPENIIEETPKAQIQTITYKQIEKGIERAKNIYQTQSIALFLLMLSCKGMYPADVMNYKTLDANNIDEILINDLFEKESKYIKLKKSKKSSKYKYVRINLSIIKLIEILKITFHITHYKKYSNILAPYNDPYHIFLIDINIRNNTYKNLWNFYQKSLKSVLYYPFTCARDSFNQIIEEQEMTGQTRDILLGNLTEKELTNINSEKLIDARHKMRDIEDIILREFRIIELTEILINKLKLIGYNIEEIKQENWETPKGFIASINKFD